MLDVANTKHPNLNSVNSSTNAVERLELFRSFVAAARLDVGAASLHLDVDRVPAGRVDARGEYVIT